MSGVVHVRTFDGGRSTPAEYHRRHALAARCDTCEAHAAVKARLLADAAEYARREPQGYLALIAQNEGRDPAFDSRWGKLVVVQELHACEQCAAGLRRRLAHLEKGYMHAELDELGLDSSHPAQVQVPGG